MQFVDLFGWFSVFEGVNPDIRYEVQYSSYVNVTTDGFVLLKKAVKTDSFALQASEESDREPYT